MNQTTGTSGRDVPDDLIAEASVWVARLHGPDRKEAERGVRRWLKKSDDHARAFELATDAWEDTGNLQRVMHWVRPKPKVWFRPMVAVAAAAIVFLVIGTLLYLRDTGVATEVGEQRLQTLEDGTRVFLNTATHLVVHYAEQERRVELKSGEALFDVAKRIDWPFIVSVGDREIRAVGTSFVVRRDEQRIAVTLVEGQVAVSSAPASTSTQNDTVTLTAGDRLTFVDWKAPTVDRPALDQVMAWRRGQVVLDDTPLTEAVAEMNRYSAVTLVIERPETGELLVNGLFQTGDSKSFAAAMAQIYGLQVIEEPRRIVLKGVPR